MLALEIESGRSIFAVLINNTESGSDLFALLIN